MSNLTVKDLEILQGTLSKLGLDYQLELDEGKILVMGPSDIISSEVGVQLIRLLGRAISFSTVPFCVFTKIPYFELYKIYLSLPESK